MKRLSIILFVLVSMAAMAQLPQSFMYQSVLRNSSGTVLTNQRVSARVSVLQSTINGTAVYVETQSVTSDADGVISITVGGGTVVSGVFAEIDWFASDYFLKTEIDPIGGSNYILTSTQQLLSVPFAFATGKTAKLIGIDSTANVLVNRYRRIDSLIAVYSVQIRHLNDSVQTLSHSPSINGPQIDALIQRKAELETQLTELRSRMTATRNDFSDVRIPQQEAVITRSPGHNCDR